MRLLSGQFITWGEFFTMGLTIFAALMTIWQARPVKFTPALKFVLGSILGFIMGGAAGLIQANVGLNLVFHNTQWVVALHAHTFLLTGVGMLLFAVIYALIPMLTVFGPLIPDLITGSIFIEAIFRVPGLGKFWVTSTINRDYPMIIGLTMLWAVLIAITYLITDILYVLADPRVRYT